MSGVKRTSVCLEYSIQLPIISPVSFLHSAGEGEGGAVSVWALDHLVNSTANLNIDPFSNVNFILCNYLVSRRPPPPPKAIQQ
jgi:hypothetical protein